MHAGRGARDVLAQTPQEPSPFETFLQRHHRQRHGLRTALSVRAGLTLEEEGSLSVKI